MNLIVPLVKGAELALGQLSRDFLGVVEAKRIEKVGRVKISLAGQFLYQFFEQGLRHHPQFIIGSVVVILVRALELEFLMVGNIQLVSLKSVLNPVSQLTSLVDVTRLLVGFLPRVPRDQNIL